MNNTKKKEKRRGGGGREGASERQYRGDVLRASGKRVVGWILWTLHGETTTVTKWTPETKRERPRGKNHQ